MHSDLSCHDLLDLGLLDPLGVGVCIYEADGVVGYANNLFRELVADDGLPSYRTQGAVSWHGLTAAGGTLAPYEFPCQRALRGETVSVGVMLRHYRGAREACWLKVSAAPIRTACRTRISGIVLLVSEQAAPSPAAESIPVYVGDTEIEEQNGDILIRCASSIRRFSSVDELMELAPYLRHGCAVVSVGPLETPGGSLDRLRILCRLMPTIVVGHIRTTADTVAAALRAGAIDFLISPISTSGLSAALHRATKRTEAQAQLPPRNMAGLSRREREVLTGLAKGGTNKSIARVLGISPRTVEVHRANLMKRFNAHCLADLLGDAAINPLHLAQLNIDIPAS